MPQRDDASFEAFVAARSDDLLRIAVLLASDLGHAEDLLQTALVKAYRRWDRISGEDPYPYVRRILVTSAASWRRLRATQEIVMLPVHDVAGPDQFEGYAQRQHVADALATLPPRMRAVLVLRSFEDLSEAATAEALDISLATVKSQAARGLARLRAHLGVPSPAIVEGGAPS